MKYGLYAIRDVKTGFMTPTMDVNDESAARNFYHAVQNSEGILYTFASDFSLFRIGEFDSESGQVEPLIPIVFVADGPAAVRAMGKESE